MIKAVSNCRQPSGYIICQLWQMGKLNIVFNFHINYWLSTIFLSGITEKCCTCIKMGSLKY